MAKNYKKIISASRLNLPTAMFPRGVGERGSKDLQVLSKRGANTKIKTTSRIAPSIR